MFVVSDKPEDASFVVCGGNNDYKEFYNHCYRFKISEPEKPETMTVLPKKLSHHCLVQTADKQLYILGGLTEKQAGDKDEGPGTVVGEIYVQEGDAWNHVATLPKPRTNFEVVASKTKLFVFAGSSGGGKGPSTQIDIFDTATKQITQAEFRLPLGVIGASLAWHGDNVLIIGGERAGKPSTGVMMLDFNDKTILSVRDLQKPRANTIIVPTAIDEILAIGGSGERTVEKRSWDKNEHDYVWQDCTSDVKGLDVLGNPNEYNSVTVTYEVSASEVDNFPALNPKSNFIFGNELSPFLLEFTEDMEVAYYPAPMRLQQKTGQMAWRKDYNTIFFVGGCDATYTYYSKKVYKFDIPGKKVERVANLSTGRTGFGICELNDTLFVTGGWTNGHQYLNTCESMDMNTAGEWKQLANMTVPRAGHFMWVDPAANIVYAAGGISAQNGQPLDTVEAYDVANNKWTVLEQKLNTPLQWAMAVPHTDEKHIIVIGGATGANAEETATKEAWLIDRANFQGFSEKPAFVMKVARYNPFTIIAGHDDQIAIIGGTKEKVMEIYSYKDFAYDPSKKLQVCNDVVYESLENYTQDLGLFTCSGC